MSYLGYSEIILNNSEMADFYANGVRDQYKDLPTNSYLFVKNGAGEIVDEYKCVDGIIQPLKYLSLSTGSGSSSSTIKPRNPQQKLAFDLLQDPKTTIKILTGIYGSGKTYLMVTTALDLMRKGQFRRIVWVRNNIEVKNSNPLGALPGTAFDKLLPFAMPLADHVGGVENLESYIGNEKIEIQHLGYIRGRDIKESIIIASESENFTKEHVQLLIGRVGEGSALWLDGDLKQVDKEVFQNNSGLSVAIDRLKGNPLFGYVHLPKSERSATAQLADLLD